MAAVVIAMRVIPRPLMTKDKKIVTLHRDNWRNVYHSFASQYRNFSVSTRTSYFLFRMLRESSQIFDTFSNFIKKPPPARILLSAIVGKTIHF